jgi:hypothetical protein
LDVAVLFALGALSLDFLPLPSVRYTHQQLLGAPVALIHGSIAWSASTDARQIVHDNGTIVTSSEDKILYSVASYKGHSGAALLFRSGQVIGLHSEGFNDLDQAQSKSRPSSRADAVRLDAPLIWNAVEAARASAAAPLADIDGGGGRRRRSGR